MAPAVGMLGTTSSYALCRRRRYSLHCALAMEEALIEVPTMRRFAGIDLISDRIPDETTILTFRHLLEKHDLGEQIFETVKTHLSARGMTMRQGTIVDATLIAAPSPTKNKEGKRDPEMHPTKKGNQWHYGM